MICNISRAETCRTPGDVFYTVLSSYGQDHKTWNAIGRYVWQQAIQGSSEIDEYLTWNELCATADEDRRHHGCWECDAVHDVVIEYLLAVTCSIQKSL